MAACLPLINNAFTRRICITQGITYLLSYSSHYCTILPAGADPSDHSVFGKRLVYQLLHNVKFNTFTLVQADFHLIIMLSRSAPTETKATGHLTASSIYVT